VKTGLHCDSLYLLQHELASLSQLSVYVLIIGHIVTPL